MKLEIWKPWSRLAFLELGVWEYILLALYALSVIMLLIRSRRDLGSTGVVRRSSSV